jgi:hypothetical protein
MVTSGLVLFTNIKLEMEEVQMLNVQKKKMMTAVETEGG